MNRRSAVLPALFVAAFLTIPHRATAEENWPQFRGPSGQGISDAKSLPVKWGEGENVKWKTAIPGKAWSCPVVWGDQVWVTNATPDARNLYAVCLNKNTGKIVHNLLLFKVASPQYIIEFNSPASPTPAIEEGRVYVTFGSPGTACIDTKTGQVLWQRVDFVCNHWRGAGSSPILYKDLLILPFDGADFQYIVAMNKRTGETVWRTDRSVDFKDLDPDGKPKADGDFRKAFSTPRVTTIDGRPTLLSLGSKALYAYEPETGKELWRIENHTAHSGSATPVIGDGLVYVQWGFDRPALWAIKPGGGGVLDESHVAWKVTRNVGSKPSGLLVDDLFYMVDDNGMASCLEAKTGKDVWRQRLKGNYSASPLFANGKIYFLNDAGHATVIQAGREFKIVSENELGDGFLASPAVGGDGLFLRSRSHLYRVEGK